MSESDMSESDMLTLSQLPTTFLVTYILSLILVLSLVLLVVLLTYYPTPVVSSVTLTAVGMYGVAKDVEQSVEH